jgi:hypothetical protein
LKESFYFKLSDWAKLQLALAFTSTGEADSTIIPQLFHHIPHSLRLPFA